MKGKRRFQTPELMQNAADLYFEIQAEKERLPTLSGLALALGFSSLGALARYRNYDDGDFREVIDMARLRIMDELENAAANGKSGAQFLLKNIDKEFWRDRTEQALDVTDQRDQMTADERANRLIALMERARGRIPTTIDGEAVTVEDDGWME